MSQWVDCFGLAEVYQERTAAARTAGRRAACDVLVARELELLGFGRPRWPCWHDQAGRRVQSCLHTRWSSPVVGHGEHRRGRRCNNTWCSCHPEKEQTGQELLSSHKEAQRQNNPYQKSCDGFSGKRLPRGTPGLSRLPAAPGSRQNLADSSLCSILGSAIFSSVDFPTVGRQPCGRLSTWQVGRGAPAEGEDGSPRGKEGLVSQAGRI
ncbi:uncharacterized protein LOC131836745 [Mustela lutreola]|uniref:uncharacterized protein LOC131836745 n=1 Tax=Mustela lutreola TaxID=9666 RepID=UPI0027978CE2|nr:uncharacterized protein LOC131836745 [Mustela lutreola]